MSYDISVSTSKNPFRQLFHLHTLLNTNKQAKISAVNTAIPSAIKLAEALKHEKKGIHQQNTFERLPKSSKVQVTIHLSLSPLDPSHKGYQIPLPDSQVQEKSFAEPKKSPSSDQNPSKTDSIAVNSDKDKNSGVRGRGFSGRGVRRFNRRGGRRTGFDYIHQRSVEKQVKSEVKAPGMEKYRLVNERMKEKRADDEVFVSVLGAVGRFVRESLDVVRAKGEVKVKAFGNAVGKAVRVAEMVRKVEKGLHQENSFGSKSVSDRYVPIEEGLDEVVKERVLSFVEIVLSKNARDVKHTGYIPPFGEVGEGKV